MSTVHDLLDRHRFVICVGTGGVGKTTIAAALALRAAQEGRRALVLTIDPARRLADALGVSELSNEPAELAVEYRERLQLPPQGRLYAMMLDMKGTFDDLVERFAEDPETKQRILENRIYANVSDALAGSSEYAAMEKLYEISESTDFDTIILDTPPAAHAIDFIEAPERLLEFLDSRVVRGLVHPALAAGRFGFRLLQGTLHRVFKLIERVAGVGFLEDISEFLLAFEDMSGGFRTRARHVQERIFGPGTAFVLVASASASAAEGALELLGQLEASKVRLSGIVVNRMHLWPDRASVEVDPAPHSGVAALRQAFESAGAAPEIAAEAAEEAIEAAKSYAALVQLDFESTRLLRAHTGTGPEGTGSATGPEGTGSPAAGSQGMFFRCISELPEDVHDSEGLCAVAAQLFGSETREIP